MNLDLVKKLAPEAYDKIAAADKIAKAVEGVNREIEVEHSRHRKAVAALKQKLEEVHNTCTHSATKYRPDASGNNDSSTECLICGADL